MALLMVPVPTNPIFVLERLMLATRAASSASQQQQRGDLVIGDAFVEFSNEGEKSGAKARVVSSVRESERRPRRHSQQRWAWTRRWRGCRCRC